MEAFRQHRLASIRSGSRMVGDRKAFAAIGWAEQIGKEYVFDVAKGKWCVTAASKKADRAK